MKNNSVAILYICIGKYIAFWEDFYKSFEKNFLPDYLKAYFVFTDSPKIWGEEENPHIHRIYQEDLGWPGNTLFRYKMFLSVLSKLKEYDYTFFMNANVICLTEITAQMILPLDKEFTVVQHPAYYNKKPYEFDYEYRKKSLAYIPCGSGNVYICGGINGGKTASYIKLIQTLAENIDKDFNRGITAKWHDESHINNYILGRTDYRLLSPSFCYPEGWSLPFEPLLLVREKSTVIPLDAKKERRAKRQGTLIGKILLKLLKMKRLLIYKIKTTTGVC